MNKKTGSSKELSKVEVCVLSWQYRLTGSFKRALWAAIDLADDENLQLLRLGFPDEIDGYIRYREEDGWWEAVQEKAKAAGWRI